MPSCSLPRHTEGLEQFHCPYKSIPIHGMLSSPAVMFTSASRSAVALLSPEASRLRNHRVRVFQQSLNFPCWVDARPAVLCWHFGRPAVCWDVYPLVSELCQHRPASLVHSFTVLFFGCLGSVLRLHPKYLCVRRR